MAKFNTTQTKPATGIGPIVAERQPSGLTHEGAPGFAHDAKSALFLLAVSNMVGEATFYESANDRDERYEKLVHEVAVADPAWTAAFLSWLRSDGNMRSASLVGALEAAKAMLGANITGSRQLVSSVLQRADEPGEALAYWTSRYGRAIPKPVKRGVADAVGRLYTEYNLLKYDTASKGFRFGDVLDLVHPSPRQAPTPTNVTIADVARAHGVDPGAVEEALRRVADTIRRTTPDDIYIHLGTADFVHRPMPNLERGWRSTTAASAIGIPESELRRQVAVDAKPSTWRAHLFRHALDRRHGRENEIPIELPMLTANAFLRTVAVTEPEVLLATDRLREAGMTWEDVLSLVGAKVDKGKLWTALIPTMGYMALLRNLRNFDEAGVSDTTAYAVCERLADPAQVARSRQFPFRFLSAYEQVANLRWGHALDKALQASLSNLPALPGRSLILVDTSASMTNMTYSARSKVTPAKAAAVFGVALAAKGEQVDLCGFADGVFRHDVRKGASVIREVDHFLRRTGEVGHGTQIAASVRATYRGHDRVFIISDMQTMDGGYGQGVSEAVPSQVPIYGFNLGGYEHTAIPAGAQRNRHEFGGLTDATFRMVPLLEAGRDGNWPWA